MIGSVNNSTGAGSSGSGFMEPAPPRVEEQQSFARALAIENRLNERMSDSERAREAAERLVSATFVEPLLSQMRESTDAAPPFAPTRAEKQLRALADTMTAHNIVKAARMPLVDRIAADLMARSGKGTS